MQSFPNHRTILVFAPHPDDEVIATGGTICMHRRNGNEVRILFATDGSQSHAAVLGITSNPSPDDLVALRRDEAIAAAAVLGVDASHVHFFGFPDTMLAAHAAEFRQAVLKVLSEITGISAVYIPDEDRELNADHRVTGKISRECIEALGLKPAIFKYTVWDQETEREFAYQNRLSEPARPRTDEEVVSIDIRQFQPSKIAAMEMHRTQTALVSPAQTRPVVPRALMDKLRQKPSEEFVRHSPV
jgi:LmbE family N-acetylglucosaminyl deacetylase